MKNSSNAVLILLLCGFYAPAALAGCPPAGYTRVQLLELKGSGFMLEDEAERNQLAIGLAGCTADADPAIRDGVAFEALSAWLRAQSLSAATVDQLRNVLSGQLSRQADNTQDGGFEQPFAALILSEVVRTDRIEAVFTPAQRAELVALAADYLASVEDYRGFSESEGWRHGVAHGADLVLQLVLNPNISAEQIESLMNAVATQVSPPGAVFYIYGEPSRLARAVFYAYNREAVPRAFWEEWFLRISSAAPLDSWADAFSSQAGLAKRHNTLGFLMAMYLNADAGGDERNADLSVLVSQAINRVLGG